MSTSSSVCPICVWMHSLFLSSLQMDCIEIIARWTELAQAKPEKYTTSGAGAANPPSDVSAASLTHVLNILLHLDSSVLLELIKRIYALPPPYSSLFEDLATRCSNEQDTFNVELISNLLQHVQNCCPEELEINCYSSNEADRKASGDRKEKKFLKGCVQENMIIIQFRRKTKFRNL